MVDCPVGDAADVHGSVGYVHGSLPELVVLLGQAARMATTAINGHGNLNIQYLGPLKAENCIFVTLYTPITYGQTIKRAHDMLDGL
jgi:hypothetical protein